MPDAENTTDTKPYPGWLGLHDFSSHLNATKFLVRQMMADARHFCPVLVKAVHNGGLPHIATVDVQPMVNQIDQDGNAQAHGTIYGLPVARNQGGTYAFIVDPVIDDIGVAAFADRDISSVVANQAPANPGSWRRFDWSDGIYIGSIGDVAASQWVWISQTGIEFGAPVTDTTGNLNVAIGVSGTVTLPTGVTMVIQAGIVTSIS